MPGHIWWREMQNSANYECQVRWLLAVRMTALAQCIGRRGEGHQQQWQRKQTPCMLLSCGAGLGRIKNEV